MRSQPPGVDRISNLPEPIITEILNLVPTKDAVVTSLLSKSWRFRWKEVGTIDLAAHRGPGVKFTVIPSEIYSFKTLEVLKLDGDFRVSYLDAGPYCLPKLTELRLIWVEYFRFNATVGKLISSCPVLQSLTVKKRRFLSHERNFIVSSLSLKHLHIYFIYDGKRRDRHLFKKLIVKAPALESLVLHDLVSMNISVTSCPVKEVDLDFHFPADPNMVVGLLDTFRDVECLKLSYNTMRALETATMSVSFERLTKLVVNCISMKSLVDLMDQCVNLQVLEIYSSERLWRLQSHFERDLETPIGCLRCLSSSLRQVTFKLVYARFDKLDQKMIEFILNHGLVMETVNLFFHHSVKKPDVAERCRRVLRMHKVSPICKIFCTSGDLGGKD